MLHLQEEMRKKISEILNDNSHDVIFDVNLYNFTKLPNFVNKYEIDNTYDIKYEKYIPTVIEEISGQFEATRGVDIAEPSVFISFMIPTEETENLGNILVQDNTLSFSKAIEEIRKKYNAKAIPLGDTGYYIKKDSTINVSETGAGTETIHIKFKANSDTEIIKDKLEVANEEIFYNGDKVSDDYNYGDVVELEIETEDDSFEFQSFDGVIYYFGVREGSDEYSLLIEDFKTPENEGEGDWNITTSDYGSGATPLGEYGDITVEFTFPNASTNQFSFGDNGANAQIFDIDYTVIYSKDIFLGNHFSYYINGEQIFPFTRSGGFVAEADADQSIGGNTAKALNADNILANTFTLYHTNSKVLNELFYEYNRKDVEQNKIWTFRVEYPTHNVEYEVIVKDLGMQGNDNSQSVVTIELEPADEL